MQLIRVVDVAEEKSGDRENSSFQSFRTQWKEFDGVHVPTSVTIEEKAIVKVANQREKGREESTLKLNWLSVNRPLDESYFDGSSMRSTEQIQEMIEVETTRE